MVQIKAHFLRRVQKDNHRIELQLTAPFAGKLVFPWNLVLAELGQIEVTKGW